MYASSITTAERNGHPTTFQETEPENGYLIGRPDTITGYRQQNTKISLERKGHFAGFEVMFFKDLNGQKSSLLNFFAYPRMPCELPRWELSIRLLYFLCYQPVDLLIR